MTLSEYQAEVCLEVERSTGWTTTEVESMCGDLSEMFEEGLTPREAADTIQYYAAQHS